MNKAYIHFDEAKISNVVNQHYGGAVGKLPRRSKYYCIAAAIFLGGLPYHPVVSRTWAAQSAPERRLVPVKEAKMELKMRLNVLAAIVSFAFLTAIVFGMV
jgi:hypothetical protein